ncbi:uncharacterized protein PHACADRAFT_85922, partial [Phanerochaete carnosa HHB-10118-sp]
RFAAILDSLPRDARQTLVYQQLIPLLNNAPKSKIKKALNAAARLQKRHAGMPDLDLRGKKLEITNMLKELNKDTKRAYVMDTSNLVELLNEIADSLAVWMSDVWVVVYEHNVDFDLAHDCLLFVSSTLDQLENVRMGCKCALDSLYIPVTIRNRKGRVVKRFDVNGATHLEDVTLFIWRDMFLSMLAYGSQRHKDLIPRMLGDIEDIMSWKAVVRLMFNKSQVDAKRQTQSGKESDWEDVDSEDGGESLSLEDQSDSGAISSLLSDDDDNDELDLDVPRLRHWSDIIFGHVHLLQRHIEDALVAIFETTPSLTLYSALLSIAQDPQTLEERLLFLLKAMATACSDTYAVALEIYSLEHKVDRIVDLLGSYSYLLRPRDAAALQAATKLISHHSHARRALQILEAELLDTIRMTHRALLQSFSQLDTSANRAEILQIHKNGSRAPGRRNRVEAWVDAVTTPGADQPNPMMFAAMFMGIAPLPGLHSDDDPYTYLDLDPHDPDLEDLRSEYRPSLKKRFESWTDVGLTLMGGPEMLLVVYRKLIEKMPFLRAPDVTEEMIARLQDRRSKAYVVEGLDALLAFAKVQRRKWYAAKAEKSGNAASSSSSAQLPTYASPAGPSRPPNMPPSSTTSTPVSPLRPDSPGPPPLVPVSSLTDNKPRPPPPVPASPPSPGPPPLIPASSLATSQPTPPQASTSQPLAPLAQPPQPGGVAWTNTNTGVDITLPIVVELDAILAATPPPPEDHTPLTLLNLLIGGGPPPVGGGAQAGSSSIDDVD